MTDKDRNLRLHLKKESDEILFSPIELNDQVKQKIRQQAAAEKANRRRLVFPKSWVAGAAVLAAAVVIIAGVQIMQQPAAPTPEESSVGNLPSSNTGSAGSELSQLITTPLSSVEEAKALFGASLLVPNYVPEDFKLSDIVAVGMEGEPLRDVTFTYVSDEKTFTFTASRMQAAFPVDLFTPTKVNSVDGFIFEQPELTELYWMEGGIQYGITGPFSADEAMKVAESAEA